MRASNFFKFQYGVFNRHPSIMIFFTLFVFTDDFILSLSFLANDRRRLYMYIYVCMCIIRFHTFSVLPFSVLKMYVCVIRIIFIYK